MSIAVNPVLVETTRRDHAGRALVENRHCGALAVADSSGALILAMGDVGRRMFPRSAVKMIQALPLVESGAADRFGLKTDQLALCCASHEGGAEHVGRVAPWLAALGLGERDLGCGPQEPGDKTEKARLDAAHEKPCRLHHNCSGKHAGFLTLARDLKADPAGYLAPDEPVQKAIAAAFAEATGQSAPPPYGVDGCAAPNFTADLAGLARAMAAFARPKSDARGRAMGRLRDAMKANPRLIAGEGRACTELTEALPGGAVVKVGADGVYTAILPEQGLGLALKIDDGSIRAAETALAGLLVRLKAADAALPALAARLNQQIHNSRGALVGEARPAMEV